MKKIILLSFFIFSLTFVFAQKREICPNKKNYLHKTRPILKKTKDLHDTLFYFEGYYYTVNPGDLSNFNIKTENLDTLTAAQGYPWDSEWKFWYTQDTSLFITPTDWARDTANYTSVTSWFNPPGQADDWFEFGPITIPSKGADLHWMQRFNTGGGYRNAYEILLCTTGMNNYSDFTQPPIYVMTDTIDTTFTNIDTVWTLQTAKIPKKYNGKKLYFAIHHNSINMDVLWIDEITVTEENNMEVPDNLNTNDVKLYQNIPNPANNKTIISYKIKRNAEVTLEFYDLTGQLFLSLKKGFQSAGKYSIAINTEKFQNGIYYYSLKVNNRRITKRMLVYKK